MPVSTCPGSKKKAAESRARAEQGKKTAGKTATKEGAYTRVDLPSKILAFTGVDERMLEGLRM